MSVQVHAELVQALAGNAVVAKTPSQGGFHTLTVAHAIMRRQGLPVTLLSGAGAELGNALISGPGIGALAFVGGRANGRKAATTLADTGKRHFLEQEGLNAWGIWDFSDWDGLAAHLRKGFEYAKQRCTAYPRYVVQRELFPDFLQVYLPVIQSLRFGHPLAVETSFDPFPDLDFGPVIHASKAAELREQYAAAITGGAIPLYRGTLSDGRFLDGQDTAAYVAPASVLAPPTNWELHHAEPFGPAGQRRHRRHPERAAGGHERVERVSRCLDSNRRPRLRRPHRRATAGLQGRDQQAAQPRRPRGDVRRPGCLMEGCLHRRRPARAAPSPRAQKASASSGTSRPTAATPRNSRRPEPASDGAAAVTLNGPERARARSGSRRCRGSSPGPAGPASQAPCGPSRR